MGFFFITKRNQWKISSVKSAKVPAYVVNMLFMNNAKKKMKDNLFGGYFFDFSLVSFESDKISVFPYFV